MNSSKEIEKAGVEAERMAGELSGSMTRRNVVQSEAPRSRAASRMVFGMAAKRLRMITTVVGSATNMWPRTMAMRDGPRPMRLMRMSRALPTMLAPGMRIGSRAIALMVAASGERP